MMVHAAAHGVELALPEWVDGLAVTFQARTASADSDDAAYLYAALADAGFRRTVSVPPTGVYYTLTFTGGRGDCVVELYSGNTVGFGGGFYRSRTHLPMEVFDLLGDLFPDGGV